MPQFWLLRCAPLREANAVTIDMVTVGNPGNAPDTRYDAAGLAPSATSTRSASTKSRPASTPSSSTPWPRPTPTGFTTRDGRSRWCVGANIQQIGSSPDYSYSVAADWADRPVNYVSFWDAARFANWLHNGQPTGPQGPGTTEDGAYHNVGNQDLFGRNPGARSSSRPRTSGTRRPTTIRMPDWPPVTSTIRRERTPHRARPDRSQEPTEQLRTSTGPLFDWQSVLSHAGRRIRVSDSPYGTFDQGGNVFEWNETVVFDIHVVCVAGRSSTSSTSARPACSRTTAAATAPRTRSPSWGSASQVLPSLSRARGCSRCSP